MTTTPKIYDQEGSTIAAERPLRSSGLLVAAARSGSGKTTITAGIMSALRRRGVSVGGAKVGPDYIDPSYHRIACGRPSYNLDPYLTGGSPGVLRSLQRAAEGAEITVVEGVMGLFDGAYDRPSGLSTELSDTGDSAIPFASTAHIAVATSLPVILIVDVEATSQTAAAIVHGLATYSPACTVTAVILNKVASPRHETSIARALAARGIPFLGALPASNALRLDRRHLGLIPAAEYVPTLEARLREISDEINGHLDLDTLVSLARPVPQLTSHSSPTVREPQRTPVVSYATGAAFSFTYQENLDLLREAGARLQPFDPLHDEAIPSQTDLCLLGGGFPETYLDVLGANKAMLSSLRAFALQGGAIWAECGGHLLLGRSLETTELAGLLPTRATMTTRLTMGYRDARATQDNLLFEEGERFTAHEFHYSHTEPEGSCLAYSVGTEQRRSGFGHERLLSSYLHVHLAGQPAALERLLRISGR
jgi:cobyrinic acid a,c-diamide synthase